MYHKLSLQSRAFITRFPIRRQNSRRESAQAFSLGRKMGRWGQDKPFGTLELGQPAICDP